MQASGELRRSGSVCSSGLWGSGPSIGHDLNAVFSMASSRRGEEEDQALTWAALERLPTYDRVRRGIIHNVLGEQSEVDVTNLSFHDRQLLLDRLFNMADDNSEQFLFKMRERIDKVGLGLPRIEVRFQQLSVEADVYIGSRALPTIPNYIFNMTEGLMRSLRIFPGRKRRLSILDDVSGIIKPGRLTLLLGPPSSGKTTLLLTLAGRLDSDLRKLGRVTYNGHDLKEFVPQRTAAYVSQRDLHIAELTVRETLDFSGRCQGVGTRYDMLVELSRREKRAGIIPDEDIDVFMKAAALGDEKAYRIVTEYVLKILGLDICADTMVGDDMLRGISGGQLKRLTTGELLVGPARVLFMDDISTGLDSSTTFQIIRYLRQSVHALDGTTVISLLQPAPETFELFDDIILLSEGQIVYQGPREDVLGFFESLGFKCPERKGVADFLQEVTSRKDQQQYWANLHQSYRYVPINEFVKAFRSFHTGRRVEEELAVPYDKRDSHPAALTTSRYGVGKAELLRASFWRELLLIKRNSFVHIFKLIQLCFVAVCTMTVFFRTKMHHTVDGSGLYLGALYFGILTCMFNGFTETAMTIAKLPVLYKQRDLFFYPCWVYAIPTWAFSIPTSVVESGIWVFLTYYVIGFDTDVQRFFRQFLVVFSVHQMATGLFRLIASVGRTMVIANTFGSFAMLIVMCLGGYVLSRESIKGWWIWGYWISPLMYAQNAISVNEFLGHSWHKRVGNETVGELLLRSRGLFSHAYWYWLGVGVLLGYAVLFNILYTVTLTCLNPIGKPHAVVSEEVLRERHANRTGETHIELTSVSLTGATKSAATEGTAQK